jgi:hypothetical protein
MLAKSGQCFPDESGSGPPVGLEGRRQSYAAWPVRVGELGLRPLHDMKPGVLQSRTMLLQLVGEWPVSPP